MTDVIRERDKKWQPKRPRVGPGGKFDSTGNEASRGANTALIVKLLPDVESGIRLLTPIEGDFIRDCRIKLNQMGGKATFGWRQVEKMVELSTRLKKPRAK